MKPGQKLVSVVVVDPANLADQRFAAAIAILTLGCKLDPGANGGGLVEFRETVQGRPQRRFQFTFDPDVKVDGVGPDEWLRRWDDPEWRTLNPQHPLASMWHQAQSLASFATWMKDHDPILVFRRLTAGGAEGVSEAAAYVPLSQNGTPRGDEILRRAGIAA